MCRFDVCSCLVFFLSFSLRVLFVSDLFATETEFFVLIGINFQISTVLVKCNECSVCRGRSRVCVVRGTVRGIHSRSLDTDNFSILVEYQFKIKMFRVFVGVCSTSAKLFGSATTRIDLGIVE